MLIQLLERILETFGVKPDCVPVEFVVKAFCTLIVLQLVYRFVLRKLYYRYFTVPDSYYIVKSSANVDQFKFLGKKMPKLDEIPAMVEEIRQSFDSGYSRPLAIRIRQLKAMRAMFTEHEQDFLLALREDLGRPRFEGLYYDLLLPLSEIDHLIAHLPEYAAPESKGFNLITFPSGAYIYKEPFGVVLVIGTWNYPIMLSMVPVLGAIAAGNCVILKPCNVSGASARLLARLVPQYLDPRICTVVGTDLPGDRDTTAALLKCKFDHIFFTGSPAVGKVIMRGAAEHLTPVTLELGGKNPVFVAADADLELAAKRTVWGRMMNCGQQCISPDYVLCEKQVLPQFTEKCKYWAQKLYGGTASKDNGDFGRIVGDSQTKRLIGLLKTHGGQVVCGGTFDQQARWIEPTVLLVNPSSPAMQEETFGPILLVTSVNSIQDAIDFVNRRPKPLSLYLFSKSHDTQQRIIYNTSAGGVTVNATLFHAAHHELPFGGVGDSGINAYHGKATFEVFCHRKPVLVKRRLPDLGLLSDPFFIYPPWTSFKEQLIRFLMKFV